MAWTTEHWEDLVLKPAHGYSGHGIFVGYLKKNREKHIRSALDIGDYIVQQLVPLGLWSEKSIWPLKEAVNGRVRHTYIPNHFRPVVEYLEPQGRFRHLFKPARQQNVLDQIQANVNAYWHEVSSSSEFAEAHATKPEGR